MAHLLKHWKKYTFGSIVLTLLGRYAWKRNEEFYMMRKYCLQAKSYGDEPCEMTARLRKVYVFLNPEANNTSARKKFEKFSAPLFHLSGMDVIIVESDYEGQIQTLMGYIDPTTEAVVVAGGGGTLMEVVNGMLRRSDCEEISIPVGVVPLGKENNFYKNLYQLNFFDSVSPKSVCESTMDIIRGHTVPVSVLKLKPEQGKVLYALTGLDWGAIYNAEKNKDSFKLFGRLRTVCSYINTAYRKWPDDFRLNIWSHDGSRSSHDQNYSSHDQKKAESDGYSSYEPLGFRLSINDTHLGVSLWPQNDNSKRAFIKHGWHCTLHPSITHIDPELPSTVLSYNEVSLSPQSSSQHWYGVDGEAFEAVPLQCSVLPDRIKVFRTKQLDSSN